jgi:hypothetical protein
VLSELKNPPTTQKKILYFFPHNPYPPKSGAHVRCLEMLKAIASLGYETILASSDYSSETVWTEPNIRMLEKDFVSKVSVYRLTRKDKIFLLFLTGLYKTMHRPYPINSSINTPPGMRIWFARLFNDVQPEAVFMSYAYWDGLIRHKRWHNTFRIVDMYDLMTLNIAMRKALESYLPTRPIRTADVDERALQEGFYAQLGLSPHPDEVRTFAKYTWTIAISKVEMDLVMQTPNHGQIIRIPVTQEPRYISNTYDGSAIFPTGPNPFNMQGYFYFIKRVLPFVLLRVKTFNLQVTGYICDLIQGEVGISLSGFIPDLQTAYSTARFMICPVFGGTGQQIKIVEAMANGLPVIALQAAALSSPLQHGVNGFIAHNAAEFAEYTIQLWNDKKLCQQMGSAAREVIATDFSQARVRVALKKIFGKS